MEEHEYAALVDEVSTGRPKLIELGGEQIALFRVGDSFYAAAATCPHAWGPLAAGELEGTKITCPLHGWTFDLETGSCTNVRGASKLQIFEVERRADALYVRIAGPAPIAALSPRNKT